MPLRWLWRLLTISQTLVFGLLGLVILSGLLMAPFSDDTPDIPDQGALVLDLQGVLVEEKAAVGRVEVVAREVHDSAPYVLISTITSNYQPIASARPCRMYTPGFKRRTGRGQFGLRSTFGLHTLLTHGCSWTSFSSGSRLLRYASRPYPDQALLASLPWSWDLIPASRDPALRTAGHIPP